MICHSTVASAFQHGGTDDSDAERQRAWNPDWDTAAEGSARKEREEERKGITTTRNWYYKRERVTGAWQDLGVIPDFPLLHLIRHQ